MAQHIVYRLATTYPDLVNQPGQVKIVINNLCKKRNILSRDNCKKK